jgi:lauroyl/myristoyl acyltransferase
MGDAFGAFIGIVFAFACIAAWINHMIYCFTEQAYVLLLSGAVFFPIGIIHGFGRWFGWWG